MRGVELTGDFTHVGVLALEGERRSAATTRSVGMCASQLDSSSVSPSHSACSFCSTLMSTSGSTTIVGSLSSAASDWNSLPGMCQATNASTERGQDAAESQARRFSGRAPV